MGASFNQGIRQARGDYILHLEDDWLLTHDDCFIQTSIALCESHPELAAVRLYSLRGFDMPRETEACQTVTAIGQVDSLRLKNNINVYSNNPHLKPRWFHQAFGWYTEGLCAQDTEREFCSRFGQQNKWTIHSLGVYFKHIGMFSTNGFIWNDVQVTTPILYNA